MKKDKLEIAIQEAERFLEKAKLLHKLSKDSRCKSDYKDSLERDHFENRHPKESGATKRASMDLTRALADYRKPN